MGIIVVTLFFGIIPFCLYLYKRQRGIRCDKAYLGIVLLFLIASLYEAIVSLILKVNVIVWFQVYSLLEFIALFYLFINLSNYRPKIYFYVFLGIFIIVYLLSFRFLTNEFFLVSKTINKAFIMIFVIVSSFVLIRENFTQKTRVKLLNRPDFYIVIGLFVYYTITIPLFIFCSYRVQDRLYFLDYWLINILASLALRIVISIGIWKIK
ncbi:hypothetical protein SAMN04488018_12523 [Myroides marinus]|uniref:Histidine kinase N-terminal 7TM region domain-containing protein n=1 Tax=Myroides marinus TaxID=703342 RepID=A0A1H6XYA8_9FLAO|nr:hypothetical protein SAMN04488018_12523 [Myroides marinus]